MTGIFLDNLYHKLVISVEIVFRKIAIVFFYLDAINTIVHRTTMFVNNKFEDLLFIVQNSCWRQNSIFEIFVFACGAVYCYLGR